MLAERFTSYIQKHNLFLKQDMLLLAISGGIDSVVLCELCRHSGFDFVIAHCNFQLRGEESERDEIFVRSLGEKYDTAVLVKKFKTEKYAKENKLSIQEAARELRYAWFTELVNGRWPKTEKSSNEVIHHSPFTIHHIVTAHHADDNVETILMNFLKGTGIAGLRGMLPLQGKIVRPLLFAQKEELLQFAKVNRLQWVEDSTNLLEKYSRNYVRHSILPVIKKIYPEAESNLLDNAERFRDIELLYHQSIERHKKRLVERKGSEWHIPVLKLKKSEPLHTIVYELIKEFHFGPAQVNEMIRLLDSETGKFIQSSTHRIIKNRNWLIISPVETGGPGIVIIESEGSYRFAGGEIILRISGNNETSASERVASLDASLIQFPLLLRKWKQGDYFYPLGMKKKKKLARFFIDQKLSKTDKEKVWVLEMDKRILWVVGYRIDERFKITDNTTKVLQVSLKSL